MPIKLPNVQKKATYKPSISSADIRTASSPKYDSTADGFRVIRDRHSALLIPELHGSFSVPRQPVTTYTLLLPPVKSTLVASRLSATTNEPKANEAKSIALRACARSFRLGARARSRNSTEAETRAIAAALAGITASWMPSGIKESKAGNRGIGSFPSKGAKAMGTLTPIPRRALAHLPDAAGGLGNLALIVIVLHRKTLRQRSLTCK